MTTVERKEQIATWNGDASSWLEYVKRVRLQYERTEPRKRKLLGAELASRLSGRAWDVTSAEVDHERLPRPDGASYLLTFLEERLCKTPVPDVGQRLEEFFMRLRRTPGASMMEWSTALRESYRRLQRAMARQRQQREQQLQKAQGSRRPSQMNNSKLDASGSSKRRSDVTTPHAGANDDFATFPEFEEHTNPGHQEPLEDPESFDPNDWLDLEECLAVTPADSEELLHAYATFNDRIRTFRESFVVVSEDESPRVTPPPTSAAALATIAVEYPGHAVIDTGATDTLASLEALEQVMALRAKKFGPEDIQVREQRKKFRFGNGESQRATSFVEIPQILDGQQISLGLHAIDAPGVPVLLSVRTLRKLGAVIDMATNTMHLKNVSDRPIQLKRSSNEHLLLDLTSDWYQQDAGHSLKGSLMTASEYMEPSKSSQSMFFQEPSFVGPQDSESQDEELLTEEQYAVQHEKAKAKSSKAKTRVPSSEKYDYERMTGPDPRDPRTQGFPCWGNHQKMPEGRGSLSGRNGHGRWSVCQKCRLRLEYIPTFGAKGTFRQAGPLPKDVETVVQQVGTAVEDHPPAREMLNTKAVGLIGAEESMRRRLQQLENEKSALKPKPRPGESPRTSPQTYQSLSEESKKAVKRENEKAAESQESSEGWSQEYKDFEPVTNILTDEQKSRLQYQATEFLAEAYSAMEQFPEENFEISLMELCCPPDSRLTQTFLDHGKQAIRIGHEQHEECLGGKTARDSGFYPQSMCNVIYKSVVEMMACGKNFNVFPSAYPIFDTKDLEDLEEKKKSVRLLSEDEKKQAGKLVDRLRKKTGHPSNAALAGVLRHRGAHPEIIQMASQHHCSECQELRAAPLHAAATLEKSDTLWEVLVVDNMQFTADGATHHYMVMMDEASRLVCAHHLFSHDPEESRNATAQEVMDGLGTWFLHYGMPAKVRMDAEGAFRSTLLGQWCSERGLELLFCAAEDHGQIGLVERAISTLKSTIRQILQGGDHSVKEAVIAACCTHNSMERIGGYSPCQWAFGRQPTLTGRMHDRGHDDPWWTSSAVPGSSVMQNLRLRVKAQQSFLQAQAHELISRASNSKTRKEQIFLPGDLVYFKRIKPPAQSQALMRMPFKLWRWYGPARVLASETRTDSFGTQRKPSNIVWIVSQGRLKRCSPSQLRHASAREKVIAEGMSAPTAVWTFHSLARDILKGEYGILDDQMFPEDGTNDTCSGYTHDYPAKFFHISRLLRDPGYEPDAMASRGAGRPLSELFEQPLFEKQRKHLAADTDDVLLATSFFTSNGSVQIGNLACCIELPVPHTSSELRRMKRSPENFFIKKVKGAEVKWHLLDEQEKAKFKIAKEAEVSQWLQAAAVKAAIGPEVCFIGWSDAALANRRDLGSTGGYIIAVTSPSMLDGKRSPLTFVSWRSARLQRKARSSLAAEAQALAECDQELMFCRLAWAELCGFCVNLKVSHEAVSQVPGCVVIDAKALYDVLMKKDLNSSGLGLRDKFSALEILCLLESIDLNKTTVRWVHSEAQLADALTKPLPAGALFKAIVEGHWTLSYDPDFTSAKRLKSLRSARGISSGQPFWGMSESEAEHLESVNHVFGLH
ncbi:Retrovirus-related Pol polyprotein from transposon TNT 1-94 [Durusdinium trenchii]|uniref:Retrovirus-related Pol polyprotein from transposon TNT 1-94 n=1 Tax=Durusdinium trenchii TaxID=1381693 RepID=A0ABP0SQ29_9DINO